MNTFPNRVIAIGEQDAQMVKSIQDALARKGYGPFAAGVFDVAMASAVKLFQSQYADVDGHALAVDGVVGRYTWGALFGTESITPASAPSTLMLHALAIAGTQVGQMEVPPSSNRGPMVDHYLLSVFDQIPASVADRAWCMAFVHWSFMTAANSLGVSNPVPKTAGCLDHWARAVAHGAVLITTEQAFKSPALIKPGLVFVLDLGGGHGHTGFVERLTPAGRLATVEGNTNTDGSADGVGVFRLDRRKLSDSDLKGFIDYTGA